MTDTGEACGELFCFRSSASRRGHRFSVSAYLVERLDDSNLVARMEPLGLIPKSATGAELLRLGPIRDLAVVGAWRRSPSGRHVVARVAMPVLGEHGRTGPA